MKAINRKDRRRARWRLVAVFIPMIALMAAGLIAHQLVKGKHVYDLSQKEDQYEEVFKSQAKQGLEMDKLIESLEKLKDPEKIKSYKDHLNAQENINLLLGKLRSIQPNLPDTALKSLRSIPGIYDSLVVDIKLIQTTRDSIKDFDERIKNLKFQLKQCLNPEDEEEKQKK